MVPMRRKVGDRRVFKAWEAETLGLSDQGRLISLASHDLIGGEG